MIKKSFGKKIGSGEQGFTLTELMFAMTFIAFIMVFIVVVILQMMNVYNKGIAMSQINQAGRQIGDDLNSRARFAKPSSVIYNSAARRLCFDGVSYLWNLLDDRNNANSVKNYFTGESGEARKVTRLGVVRVDDAVGEYCNDTTKMPASNEKNMTILASSNIAILAFDIILVPSTTKDVMQVKIVLSTTGDNKPVKTGDRWTCLGSGGGTDSNPYCAFGEFDNIIYMRGGV